jgi:CBS domain-containing protein
VPLTSCFAAARRRAPELTTLAIRSPKETAMKIRDAMTRDVRLLRPDQTIREAAHLMAELDIGALPVEEGDRLIGMITDRDIAVRAVAEGRSADTPVREAMTQEIKYCYDDQDVEEVTRNMGEQRLRRLPVVDRNKRLVGILSLGDLAIEARAQDEAGEALGGISRPGGEHSQSTQRH